MQPALAAAAGQFQRRLARPPPDAKVEELKVQAHRSAFSYPDAVYLRATPPSSALLQGRVRVHGPVHAGQQLIRTLSTANGIELPAGCAWPVWGSSTCTLNSGSVFCCEWHAWRDSRGTLYQALMRGSVAVSTSSWDMMEAMPSASALKLGVASTLLAP